MADWDFFVSYTQADRAWAEWIAWELEEDGHRVLVQAWDFVPGSNWVQSMQDGATRAKRTIAVLSPAYLRSVYGGVEWKAAWTADPDGRGRRLLPVRVSDCTRPGLLADVVGIDVFGVSEAKARARLRAMVAQALTGRAKPDTPPGFPGARGGSVAGRAIGRPARFPGASAPGARTAEGAGESHGGDPTEPTAEGARGVLPARRAVAVIVAAASVLFCTLAVIAALDGGAAKAGATEANPLVDSATLPADPVHTSTTVAPPATSVAPTPPPTARPSPGPAQSPAVDAPDVPPATAVSTTTGSPGCQQRAQYRVTEDADVVDAHKTEVGRAAEGDLFVVLDEPVHVEFRRYGTVGNGGSTGYVLQDKLAIVGTVCV